MTNTDKILELKEMLDDPRTGLKDSSNTNKTRYGILALFETAIAQALAEERKRVRGEIEKRKISKNNFDLLVMEYMRSGTLDTPEFTIRVLQTDFNKTLDDLLSSLDKPLTDN